MSRFSFFTSLFSWLTQAGGVLMRRQIPSPAPRNKGTGAESDTAEEIAWGGLVSAAFKHKAIGIARRLEMDPNHLMAIIAFETGRSFDPAETNRAGSGATGLIQFMPSTARQLGTSTDRLARMDAVAQLDYVEKYLTPYAGKMTDLPSAYMAVLYPRAVDKQPDYVLFRKGSKAYKLNRGLDADRNGQITKAEAANKVSAMLAEGLRRGFIG